MHPQDPDLVRAVRVAGPSLQRDFLLSLAAEGSYRPVWSAQILAELEYEQARKLLARHGLDHSDATQSAARLVAAMRSAFDGAEVTGWEPLVRTYDRPDPDDEHVLADEVDVLRPAEFAANTVVLSPAAADRAVGELAARSGRHRHSFTVAEVIPVARRPAAFTRRDEGGFPFEVRLARHR